MKHECSACVTPRIYGFLKDLAAFNRTFWRAHDVFPSKYHASPCIYGFLKDLFESNRVSLELQIHRVVGVVFTLTCPSGGEHVEGTVNGDQRAGGAMDRGNRAAAARVRGSSFMRTIQMCAAAAVVCLAGVSLAGEKWDSKDPSQSSSAEIDKLLHDSPWAQKAKVQLGQTMGGNGQGPNSGGGNYPNGGGGGIRAAEAAADTACRGSAFRSRVAAAWVTRGAGVEAGAAAIAVRRHLMSTPPCAGRVRCRCAWPMRNRIRRRSRRRRLR